MSRLDIESLSDWVNSESDEISLSLFESLSSLMNGSLYGVKLFSAKVERVVWGREVVKGGT